MKYQPHEYQNYATKFIVDNPISAIFLDMGLGKSVITLTAINELIYDRFEMSKVLVVAPLRVARDTWPQEIKKWEHLNNLKYSVVVGNVKERRMALLRKADIYIINRENLEWLIEKSNINFNYDMLVLDELSSFKSRKAKRFQVLKKVRPSVRRIVGLTGTPAPNGLMDLWAEIGILDFGVRLGRYISQYQNKYFRPDKWNGQQIFSWKPLVGAEKEIYKKIEDITISMKCVDYLKMPECIINKVEVEMSEIEYLKYKAMKNDMCMQVKEILIDAINAASLSGKLLQLSNGAIYFEEGKERKVIQLHDRKLDALEDLIESANGKPVLIAYWYNHDLQRIKDRFSVEEIKSTSSIERWNKGEIPIAVIHPASAGHGLNLQEGGNILIWFGLTWSLELYQQTNARLWRQGQKNCVMVYQIITKGTIDEDVIKAIKKKM